MFILIVQHNRALGAFTTRSRRSINATDEKRACALVASTVAAETGYYDVLLCCGTCASSTFSDLAIAVPRDIYNNAIDSIVGIK